jgi:hypothetical protein
MLLLMFTWASNDCAIYLLQCRYWQQYNNQALHDSIHSI